MHGITPDVYYMQKGILQKIQENQNRHTGSIPQRNQHNIACFKLGTGKKDLIAESVYAKAIGPCIR